MIIDATKLRAATGCSAEAAAVFAPAISKLASRYVVNTPMRMAAFLSQCAHESALLAVTKENLNYSAAALLAVFPKYFKTQADADAYARKPQQIANRVYGGRMGNGKEATGDGFKYRGRGLIQLTGKNNYKACGQDLDVDLENNPDWAATPEGAVATAFWFWGKNNLNALADKGSVESVTRAINGGTHGLKERQALYEKALRALS